MPRLRKYRKAERQTSRLQNPSEEGGIEIESHSSIDIISLEAKDIYNSNHLVDHDPSGYCIRNSKNEIILKKFINSFDYSLDLIKMREVYGRVYRRNNFSFTSGTHEYTQHVINVTFKYANREYNKFVHGVYLKQGYPNTDLVFTDCADVRDGVLVAIKVGEPVSDPLPSEILGKWFYYEDGVYNVRPNIAVTHTTGELREYLYENGFMCDGIKYVRYKRSSGSSRVGKCLFINEALYSRMHRWEMCGLKVKQGASVDLAALEPYIALTLSSIIGTVQIFPENILVIDDFESVFKDTCAAVTLNGTQLKTEVKEVDITNSIWDGQSLIDVDMFPADAPHGMQLLRNRFFKSCCFATRIQKFFEDHGVTEVGQLNGYTRAESVKDIKLITTPNSIKFLKFGKLDTWLDHLEPDFGVVKYEHKTPFFNGRMVQTHYQLLNSLQLTYDEVGELVAPSLDYLDKLKSDPCVLRYHIKYPTCDMGDECEDMVPLNAKNDIVYKLLGVNERFSETQLYYNFKKDLTKSFTKNLRCGHLLVNGNYSTLFGNPLEMLHSAIGAFDGKGMMEVGTVHSTRFPDGAELLGSRSPHVATGNVWVMRNKFVTDISKYFRLTPEIVCVNSINENLLERLSGADFDSDTALLTDDPILVNAAKRNYDYFAVPTKLVGSVKTKRTYTAQQQADLDFKTAVNKIGEIVNLSQELNTVMWHKLNNGAALKEVEDIYLDVALLDVLSNIAIDSAKREYPVDIDGEIKRLRKKHIMKDDEGRMIKPNFFAPVARTKGYYDPKKKNYRFHDTSMDYLQQHINKCRKRRQPRSFIPFADILNKQFFKPSKSNYDQIDRTIRILDAYRTESKELWCDVSLDPPTKHKMSVEMRQRTVDAVGNIRYNPYTMHMLLTLIEDERYSHLSSTLFNIMFGYPNLSFFDAINASKEPREVLIEHPDGDVSLYSFRFKRQTIG